ncbi:MAG: hypothetical protein H6712_14055 [Myxococcales bacterium]|nr:hypothetical protein [Myxococcales bacterium]MCB9714986.1 hypothetical protein [Myxococcales bacterium]
MRRFVLSSALLLVVACATVNPEYDPDGADTGASTGRTTEPTTGRDTDDTGGASGTGGTDARCGADLYAINEVGDLYLLDLDSGVVSRELSDNQLVESWAIGTHPGSGMIYISPINNPMTLRTVDPVTFDVALQGIPVAEPQIAPVGRAGFDASGMVWLGTFDTSLFVPVDPGQGTGGPRIFDSGTGGDMAFVAAELVLVVSEAGDGYLLDLSDNSRDEVPITGLPGEITGLAFDADDRLWASTRKGTLLRILVDWTGSTPAFTVDATQVHELRTDDEPSGIPIDDLAPVVVPPEGCS